MSNEQIDITADPTPNGNIRFSFLAHSIHYGRRRGDYSQRNNLQNPGEIAWIGNQNSYNGFGEVLLPLDARNCTNCHADTGAHCGAAADPPCGTGQECVASRCVNTAWQKPIGSAKTGFVATLADTLTPLEIFLAPQPALRSGDDIAPLRKLGVPVIAMRQNGLDYFDIHHTADDTLDKIDPKALAQNVAAYAVFAYLAAQADGNFGSAPKPAANPAK